jgi:hypothetical protein
VFVVFMPDSSLFQKLSALRGEMFQFTCRPSARKNWMEATKELLTRSMRGKNPRPSQVA